jgi:hypothetical protein
MRLRGAARAVDATLYQLRSALRPVIRMPVVTRNNRSDHLLALLGAAGGHARTLAAAADLDINIEPGTQSCRPMPRLSAASVEVPTGVARVGPAHSRSLTTGHSVRYLEGRRTDCPYSNSL